MNPTRIRQFTIAIAAALFCLVSAPRVSEAGPLQNLSGTKFRVYTLGECTDGDERSTTYKDACFTTPGGDKDGSTTTCCDEFDVAEVCSDGKWVFQRFENKTGCEVVVS